MNMRMSKNKVRILEILKMEPDKPAGYIHERMNIEERNLRRLLKQMVEQGLLVSKKFTMDSQEAMSVYEIPSYQCYLYSQAGNEYSDYWFSVALKEYNSNFLLAGTDNRTIDKVTASIERLERFEGKVDQEALDAYRLELNTYLANPWVTDVINSYNKSLLNKGIKKAKALGLENDKLIMETKLQKLTR